MLVRHFVVIAFSILFFIETTSSAEFSEEEPEVVRFHPITRAQYDAILGLTDGESVISERQLFSSGISGLTSLATGWISGWWPALIKTFNPTPVKVETIIDYGRNDHYPLCVVETSDREDRNQESHEHSHHHHHNQRSRGKDHGRHSDSRRHREKSSIARENVDDDQGHKEFIVDSNNDQHQYYYNQNVAHSDNHHKRRRRRKGPVVNCIVVVKEDSHDDDRHDDHHTDKHDYDQEESEPNPEEHNIIDEDPDREPQEQSSPWLASEYYPYYPYSRYNSGYPMYTASPYFVKSATREQFSSPTTDEAWRNYLYAQANQKAYEKYIKQHRRHKHSHKRHQAEASVKRKRSDLSTQEQKPIMAYETISYPQSSYQRDYPKVAYSQSLNYPAPIYMKSTWKA